MRLPGRKGMPLESALHILRNVLLRSGKEHRIREAPGSRGLVERISDSGKGIYVARKARSLRRSGEVLPAPGRGLPPPILPPKPRPASAQGQGRIGKGGFQCPEPTILILIDSCSAA